MRYTRSLGHGVRVLTSDYREDPVRDEEDPDVHRTLRWYWDLERYEFPRLSLLERMRLERHNAAELRRHLRAYHPHVVAWWSMGCMSLSLIEQVRRKLPAAFIVHDDWLVYGWERDQWIHTWSGPRRGRLAPFAERLCGIPARVELSDAGRFVFNSRYTLEQARAKRGDLPGASVVHPGVDESFLEPLLTQPWSWRLACIGRLDRMKGVDTAVAALAQLPPEATLTVWGSGDARYIAEVRALAGKLGVAERVTFRGFARDQALRRAYRDADVVVFPARWNEPFGLVPLEAMGLGRPVVTTVRGGTAEFVRDGENALVFAADDAPGLAACVQRLAGDAGLRSQLRDQGLRTAGRYTAAQFARRTVDEIVRAASPAGVRTGQPEAARLASLGGR